MGGRGTEDYDHIVTETAIRVLQDLSRGDGPGKVSARRSAAVRNRRPVCGVCGRSGYGRSGRWPELFVEDAFYDVIPRENYERDMPLAIMRCESRAMMQDRVRAIRETLMFEPRHVRHLISSFQSPQMAMAKSM